MKRFIETIKLSLTSKAFYQRVLEGTEPMGFKYFFGINIAFALIISAIFLPAVLAITSSSVHKKVVETIPEGLEVYVKKGVVSTNQQEPYIVENTWTKKDSAPTNLVVIDTKTPFTQSQFAEYDTAVLIKSDSIITQKNTGVVEIVQNPKELDFTFNRNWVQTNIQKFSWVGYLIPIIVFILGITLGYGIMLLIYIVWALIAWALLCAYRKDISVTFKKAYSVTLYASTLFLILELISYALPFLDGNIVKLIVYAIFLYKMTKVDEKTKEAHEHVAGLPPEKVLVDDDKNNGTE